MIQVKSLISRKKGQRSESLSVMLRFEKVLPGKVQREFVPCALQRFKCQRMGHVAAQCKGTMCQVWRGT